MLRGRFGCGSAHDRQLGACIPDRCVRARGDLELRLQHFPTEGVPSAGGGEERLRGARHVAVAVATVCVIFLLAPRLYMEGIRYEKAKWDAAEAAAVQRGADARQQAEQEIPPVPDMPTVPPPAATGPAVDSSVGRGVARVLRPRRVPHDRDRYERNDR